MSLRHAALGLLRHGPASGYDLLKSFDHSLANVWPATQSQLYGELGKLAADGLITVSAEGPRGRKEYAITDEGRAELRRWITEVEPTRVVRSDMLLRVFFLNTVSAEEAQEYLRGEAEHARGEREALERLAEEIPWKEGEALSSHGRIALEWGLRFTAMRAEWAEWAAARLRERERE